MTRINDSAKSDFKERRTAYVLLLIFVLMAAGIAITGYSYFRSYEKQYRTNAEENISAIADLKTVELVYWREDYLKDGETLLKNTDFNALARRYFNRPEDAYTQRQISMWMNLYVDNYHFDQIRIMDAQGVTRMSVPANRPPVSSAVRKRIPEVLRSGQATRVVDTHAHNAYTLTVFPRG